MRSRFGLIVVLAITMAVACWRIATALPAPAVGQETAPSAPDFSVTAYAGGRSVSLSDVRGKVVLLYFFFPT